MSPLLPVMWQIPDENGRMVDSENWSYGSVRNPLQVAYESGMEERKTRVLNGIFNADLKIIDGLNVGMQYSANIYTRQVDEFNPKMLSYYSDGSPLKANEDAKDYISQSHLDVMTQTLQFTLNFNKTIGRHELGALLGFSQEWENRTGGHVILGLPGETHDTMVEQAGILSALPLSTLKIHQLQLIRGTRMAHEYEENPEGFHLFTEVDEYIDLVIDYVEHLRPDLVLERFVSQSPKELLIAPDWGLKNYEFVTRLQKRMKERGAYQGKKYRDSEKRVIFAEDNFTTE